MKRYTIILLLLGISLLLTVGIAKSNATDEEVKPTHEEVKPTDEEVKPSDEEVEPSSLTIKEAGLGEGVENRTLLGAGDIFMEGSKVYFFTWVIDGKQGDYVTHVWIHEEEEKLRIELAIGGPSWRTWSYKNLHPGSAGNWSVEVRDPSGKVLESMRFKCTPMVSQ